MQWDEKKTFGKLAYREVFFDVPIYGESRTTDGHEVSGGCARTRRQWDAMQACLHEPRFCEGTIWRKPNMSKTGGLRMGLDEVRK